MLLCLRKLLSVWQRSPPCILLHVSAQPHDVRFRAHVPTLFAATSRRTWAATTKCYTSAGNCDRLAPFTHPGPPSMAQAHRSWCSCCAEDLHVGQRSLSWLASEAASMLQAVSALPSASRWPMPACKPKHLCDYPCSLFDPCFPVFLQSTAPSSAR